MATINDIINKVNGLRSHQVNSIYDMLVEFMTNNDIDLLSLLKGDLVCRGCGSMHLVKNGTINGIQRYKCKHCGKTMACDANTPLYNLKLKDKWVDYIHLMLTEKKSLSCVKIAQHININTKTAHAWRHKFLAAINNINPLKVNKVVEMDEVYIKFTVKGQIGNEKYNECEYNGHTYKVETQLRKDEHVCYDEHYNNIVMCMHNRQGDFDFVPIKIQKKGSVLADDIQRVVEYSGIKDITVITDSERAMIKYFKSRSDIMHETFVSADIKKGLYVNPNIHNDNINNTMNLLRRWMKGFFGFSTKYLWNYLKWFRYIRLFKSFQMKEFAKFSIDDKQSYSRFRNIFNIYNDYMYI
jgi:transposase-like protein